MAKYMVLLKSDEGEVIIHFFERYRDALELFDSASECFGWWSQLYEWGPVDPEYPEGIKAYVLHASVGREED